MSNMIINCASPLQLQDAGMLLRCSIEWLLHALNSMHNYEQICSACVWWSVGRGTNPGRNVCCWGHAMLTWLLNGRLLSTFELYIILLSADQYTTCEFNCENNLIKSPSIYNRKSDVTDSSQSFFVFILVDGKGEHVKFACYWSCCCAFAFCCCVHMIAR